MVFLKERLSVSIPRAWLAKMVDLISFVNYTHSVFSHITLHHQGGKISVFRMASFKNLLSSA